MVLVLLVVARNNPVSLQYYDLGRRNTDSTQVVSADQQSISYLDPDSTFSQPLIATSLLIPVNNISPSIYPFVHIASCQLHSNQVFLKVDQRKHSHF
jgi:hypothetical protein